MEAPLRSTIIAGLIVRGSEVAAQEVSRAARGDWHVICYNLNVPPVAQSFPPAGKRSSTWASL
jgi:hypothetical protein